MATVQWLGRAKNIAQVYEHAVGGTIGTETFTFTINGKDVAYTANGSQDAAAVATAFVTDLNASTEPEFEEITWAHAGSGVITSTVDDAGVPVTIAVSASGSATLGNSETTAATGRHFFDNVDNWSGGALPQDGDTLVFDSGNVALKYALSQGAITPAAVIVTNGYTGSIGLPVTNKDNTANTYREYRPRFLVLGNATDAGHIALTIGGGDGQGASRLNFDFADGRVTAVVQNFAGQPAENGVPTIQLLGSHASNVLTINKGSVGVAIGSGESAVFATVNVSKVSSESDAKVRFGSGVTLTNLDQSSGEVTVESATTSWEITGGIANAMAAAHASIVIDGGKLYYQSTGTLSSLIVSGKGVADFTRDLRSRTVSACEAYKGATILDSYQTVAKPFAIDLVRCGANDVKIDWGTNVTLTATAIS